MAGSTMSKPHCGNPYYVMPSIAEPTKSMRFEAQAIVSLRVSDVVGHELLFRDEHPGDWSQVDAGLVRYLQVGRSHSLLFVNLSNRGLLSASVEDLVKAHERNDVIFELSESVAEYAQRGEIATKVNTLIERGVRVAIDDFGAGRDSLERLYELAPATAVKIDRLFLQTCARRSDAARTLQYLVKQWREAGILSIAEGVENADMYKFAHIVGCDMVQGWHVDALVNQRKPG